jgi:hypothetical protein
VGANYHGIRETNAFKQNLTISANYCSIFTKEIIGLNFTALLFFNIGPRAKC